MYVLGMCSKFVHRTNCLILHISLENISLENISLENISLENITDHVRTNVKGDVYERAHDPVVCRNSLRSTINKANGAHSPMIPS